MRTSSHTVLTAVVRLSSYRLVSTYLYSTLSPTSYKFLQSYDELPRTPKSYRKSRLRIVRINHRDRRRIVKCLDHGGGVLSMLRNRVSE